MTDAATEITMLATAANALEHLCDELEVAISMLAQAPSPSLWWGAARREYETAAAELSTTMQHLRIEITWHALANRQTADALMTQASVTTMMTAGSAW